MTSGGQAAANVTLVERHRFRGWIAAIREGKGFIEPNFGSGSIESVFFAASSFTTDNPQFDLGEEVEFSLKKVSNRLVADHIHKVPLTIKNFYVSARVPSNGRSHVRLPSRSCRRFIAVAWSRPCG